MCYRIFLTMGGLDSPDCSGGQKSASQASPRKSASSQRTRKHCTPSPPRRVRRGTHFSPAAKNGGEGGIRTRGREFCKSLNIKQLFVGQSLPKGNEMQRAAGKCSLFGNWSDMVSTFAAEGVARPVQKIDRSERDCGAECCG